MKPVEVHSSTKPNPPLVVVTVMHFADVADIFLCYLKWSVCVKRLLAVYHLSDQIMCIEVNLVAVLWFIEYSLIKPAPVRIWALCASLFVWFLFHFAVWHQELRFPDLWKFSRVALISSHRKTRDMQSGICCVWFVIKINIISNFKSAWYISFLEYWGENIRRSATWDS